MMTVLFHDRIRRGHRIFLLSGGGGIYAELHPCGVVTGHRTTPIKSTDHSHDRFPLYPYRHLIHPPSFNNQIHQRPHLRQHRRHWAPMRTPYFSKTLRLGRLLRYLCIQSREIHQWLVWSHANRYHGQVPDFPQCTDSFR